MQIITNKGFFPSVSRSGARPPEGTEPEDLCQRVFDKVTATLQRTDGRPSHTLNPCEVRLEYPDGSSLTTQREPLTGRLTAATWAGPPTGLPSRWQSWTELGIRIREQTEVQATNQSGLMGLISRWAGIQGQVSPHITYTEATISTAQDAPTEYVTESVYQTVPLGGHSGAGGRAYWSEHNGAEADRSCLLSVDSQKETQRQQALSLGWLTR